MSITETNSGNAPSPDGLGSENLREVEFEPRHEPLREDVRWLGALVGKILREQEGEDLFERVEQARREAIAVRESGELDRLDAVRELKPRDADLLARAFSTYFQVVNLAEKTHRVRRRLDYEGQGIAQPASFSARIGELEARDVDAGQVAAALSELRLEPVFTAHPTEALRRSVLDKEQRIARWLVDRMQTESPRTRAGLEAQVLGEVTSGWQTAEQLPGRPTVEDEREHVLYYLSRVLYRVVPRIYEDLERALTNFGDAHVPSFIRFGSWVGGDMDGNPNVDADSLRAALGRHRELALSLHRAELVGLAERLTQTEDRVTVSSELAQLEQELRQGHADSFAGVDADMPYRRVLAGMTARLDAAARDESHGYTSAAELDGDLEILETSLIENGGARAGAFSVRRARRRVQTFGFHLVMLDCRQDAELHRAAVGDLLGDGGWHERSVAERTAALEKALSAQQAPRMDQSGPELALSLDVLAAIADSKLRFGSGAIGPYIISMAQDLDDVLSVLLLARTAVAREDAARWTETPDLEVVPLFETVDDLERGPSVLDALAQHPITSAHLQEVARRRQWSMPRQMVMVGYSDSCKDGGLAASRWALQRGQAAMVEVAERRGFRLEVFHGRGGTIGRGGGNTDEALLAAPKGSVGGTLRVTEQGEVIDEKFGLRPIALRTLDRTSGSLLLATLRDQGVPAFGPKGGDPGEAGSPGAGSSEETSVLETIAAASRACYRALVADDPRFFRYFRQATPIDVIEKLRFGSRPSSRRDQRGIEDLRAIPWVFSWTQSRHVLPGWFGLGTGLATAREAFGLDTLRGLARTSRFFSNLLSDAEMALAKADLGIARGYTNLADDPSPMQDIQAEFDRTVAEVLGIREASRLLEQATTLRRAIRLRNPYIDPMSWLQIDLLSRWRATERSDDELLSALVATVNGIARGLQNTG